MRPSSPPRPLGSGTRGIASLEEEYQAQQQLLQSRAVTPAPTEDTAAKPSKHWSAENEPVPGSQQELFKLWKTGVVPTREEFVRRAAELARKTAQTNEAEPPDLSLKLKPEVDEPDKIASWHKPLLGSRNPETREIGGKLQALYDTRIAGETTHAEFLDEAQKLGDYIRENQGRISPYDFSFANSSLALQSSIFQKLAGRPTATEVRDEETAFELAARLDREDREAESAMAAERLRVVAAGGSLGWDLPFAVPESVQHQLRQIGPDANVALVVPSFLAERPRRRSESEVPSPRRSLGIEKALSRNSPAARGSAADRTRTHPTG
jgi:hypothetical protein